MEARHKIWTGSFSGIVRYSLGLFCLLWLWPQLVGAQDFDPGPPESPVKLVFIHHSCGENWLADGHGGLGRALGDNNYFVSDTNYGWGPGSIGDRTDITDWPEWFTGPRSTRYLKALYNESRRHSSYTRNVPDPGGKNKVIMFKSCFPNSNLTGNPEAPAKRQEGLTVGNAKAIYNELLRSFDTKPDTLFVAVTAPPVQDDSLSANARAFNNWLVFDWLKDYRGNNVAVFDFYNVLTGPNNHHRYNKGSIVHTVQKGRNTLFYPTNGDNHPSPAGNRKATGEFVPLLNIYYNNWKSGRTFPIPTKKVLPARTPERKTPQVESEGQERSRPRHIESEPVQGLLIADFEKDCEGWDTFADGANPDTRLDFLCQDTRRRSGTSGLEIRYTIAPQSWATCSLVYDAPRSWLKRHGIRFYLYAEDREQKFTFVVYQGESPENLSHFEYPMNTADLSGKGWQEVVIPWHRFSRPPWEGGGDAELDLERVMGVAFAFNAEQDRTESGTIWVDDITLLER